MPKNHMKVFIIIVAILFFVFCFVPLPFQCGFCEGTGNVRILFFDTKCDWCGGSGTVHKTVWKHLNK